LHTGWEAYFRKSLREVFLTSKMNVLLVCIPLAFICEASETLGFSTCLLFERCF